MSGNHGIVRPGMTFRTAWQRCADARAGDVLLVQDGREFTYAEIHGRAASLATALLDLGIAPGIPVLLGMGNHVGFLVAHVAIQWIGAITVPLLADASFDDIAYPARHSGSGVLIADRQVWDTIRERRVEIPNVHAVLVWDGGTSGDRQTVAIDDLMHLPHAAFVDGPGDDLVPYAIVYTSGSSGRPKGVVVPSGAPLSVGLGLVDRLGLSPADTMIVPTPMSHSVGLVTALGGALLTGSRLALVPRFSPTRFWTDVKANAASLCCLFPAHLNLLMETQETAPARSETGLRAIFTHSMNEAFATRFGIPLHLCWGMTETGALMAMSHGIMSEPDAGYVGSPMPGAEIAAFNDVGNELPHGTAGELRLKHRHVMLRYHGDENATAETLVNGWVRSGDRGWTGQDGTVHYVGRIKSMIKRSGENISPEEIEAVVAALPGVAECLVFGTPDPIRTEEVVACITMKNGHCFVPGELLQAAAATLSRWKLPRFLVAWPGSLPRLANGKIDRQTVVATCDLSRAWDTRTQNFVAPSSRHEAAR